MKKINSALRISNLFWYLFTVEGSEYFGEPSETYKMGRQQKAKVFLCSFSLGKNGFRKEANKSLVYLVFFLLRWFTQFDGNFEMLKIKSIQLKSAMKNKLFLREVDDERSSFSTERKQSREKVRNNNTFFMSSFLCFTVLLLCQLLLVPSK